MKLIVKKEENLSKWYISSNLNKQFFILGNELQYLKITVNGNNKDNVVGIYIKKDDEDFSLNNGSVNEENNLFIYLLSEKDDYNFGYSIDGDDNKNIYEINKLKVKMLIIFLIY